MNKTMSIPTSQRTKTINACISSIDEVIALQTHKLELLKTHRLGLVQQLTPTK